MQKRNRLSLSTTVGVKTFNTIQQTAIDLDTTASRAIDLIVQEWVEGTKNQPDLGHLQQSLICLDEALDLVSDLIEQEVNNGK